MVRRSGIDAMRCVPQFHLDPPSHTHISHQQHVRKICAKREKEKRSGMKEM
jgi:hypothetical protein